MMTGDRAMRMTRGLDDIQLMLARDAGDDAGQQRDRTSHFLQKSNPGSRADRGHRGDHGGSMLAIEI